MSEQTNPLQGQTIRGYSLERLLGRGALTAVYNGRTQESWQLPELIITVLLLPETLHERTRAGFLRRFTTEARRLIMLRHPHLLPVYGYGEHMEYPYLFTPNTEGVILASRLREGRRWQPSEALALIAPLATALDYLHAQGLICQFLTPANILIQPDATVLLSGAGLPRMLALHELEQAASLSYPHLRSIAGTFLGAPEYLAPEVVQGGPIDTRADIYSLGILLFELLSGQPPFTGNSYLETALKHIREPLPSLHETCPDIPVALEIAVNRALHRNPQRRYQKASEFATAFAHALDGSFNTPKSLTLLRTVEQIRALPSPPPSLTLMLSSPQHTQKPVASSWPFTLLSDLQQTRPALPPGLVQSTAELLAAQIHQALPSYPTPPSTPTSKPDMGPTTSEQAASDTEKYPSQPAPAVGQEKTEPLPSLPQLSPSVSPGDPISAPIHASPFSTNPGDDAAIDLVDDDDDTEPRLKAITPKQSNTTDTQRDQPVPEPISNGHSLYTRPASNGRPITTAARNELDTLSRELRAKRERLQRQTRAYIRSPQEEQA